MTLYISVCTFIVILSGYRYVYMEDVILLTVVCLCVCVCVCHLTQETICVCVCVSICCFVMQVLLTHCLSTHIHMYIIPPPPPPPPSLSITDQAPRIGMQQMSMTSQMGGAPAGGFNQPHPTPASNVPPAPEPQPVTGKLMVRGKFDFRSVSLFTSGMVPV